MADRYSIIDTLSHCHHIELACYYVARRLGGKRGVNVPVCGMGGCGGGQLVEVVGESSTPIISCFKEWVGVPLSQPNCEEGGERGGVIAVGYYGLPSPLSWPSTDKVAEEGVCCSFEEAGGMASGEYVGQFSLWVKIVVEYLVSLKAASTRDAFKRSDVMGMKPTRAFLRFWASSHTQLVRQPLRPTSTQLRISIDFMALTKTIFPNIRCVSEPPYLSEVSGGMTLQVHPRSTQLEPIIKMVPGFDPLTWQIPSHSLYEAAVCVLLAGGVVNNVIKSHIATSLMGVNTAKLSNGWRLVTAICDNKPRAVAAVKVRVSVPVRCDTKTGLLVGLDTDKSTEVSMGLACSSDEDDLRASCIDSKGQLLFASLPSTSSPTTTSSSTSTSSSTLSSPSLLSSFGPHMVEWLDRHKVELMLKQDAASWSAQTNYRIVELLLTKLTTPSMTKLTNPSLTKITPPSPRVWLTLLSPTLKLDKLTQATNATKHHLTQPPPQSAQEAPQPQQPHHTAQRRRKRSRSISLRPTDSHTRPTDSHTRPTDSHPRPTDSHTRPTDSHKRPTDSHTRPPDSHKRPTDSHTGPADSRTRPTQANKRSLRPTYSNTLVRNSNRRPNQSLHTRPTDSHTRPTDSHTRPTDSHPRPTDSHTRPRDTPTRRCSSSSSRSSLRSRVDGCRHLDQHRVRDGPREPLRSFCLVMGIGSTAERQDMIDKKLQDLVNVVRYSREGDVERELKVFNEEIPVGKHTARLWADWRKVSFYFLCHDESEEVFCNMKLVTAIMGGACSLTDLFIDECLKQKTWIFKEGDYGSRLTERRSVPAHKLFEEVPFYVYDGSRQSDDMKRESAFCKSIIKQGEGELVVNPTDATYVVFVDSTTDEAQHMIQSVHAVRKDRDCTCVVARWLYFVVCTALLTRPTRKFVLKPR
eukprot:GHVN01056270.1.p1 GENE.GHVN01056270.1~~GHVN01056270.1.p1  ORF type:complete len:916 (-),score=230.85 GHVN01056270.1:1195-3942(-)